MALRPEHLPLNALQGFEAAGRHLNMRRAGEELNLTASAISHQVRSLESALGRPLFGENRRTLALTPYGRRLLLAVQQGLEEIFAAAVHMSDEASFSSLTVSASPAFCAQWLVPRLPRFLELFPDLNFSLVQNNATTPADLPAFDLAIVFNSAHFPGMRAETLVRLDMFPVCAPQKLLSKPRMAVEDLQYETLIHEDQGEIWSKWFAALGADQSAPRRNIFTSDTQSALSLAAAGAGFAIDDGIMGGLLAHEGRLVRPFGDSKFSFGEYTIVTPTVEVVLPVALAFSNWVRREFDATKRDLQS